MGPQSDLINSYKVTIHRTFRHIFEEINDFQYYTRILHLTGCMKNAFPGYRYTDQRNYEQVKTAHAIGYFIELAPFPETIYYF